MSKAETDEHSSGASTEKKAPPPRNEKKWGSFLIRAIWTIAMVAMFIGAILSGHVWLALMINCLQILAYREVINITGDPEYFRQVPWGRAISWYLLVVAMYFLNGEAVVSYFRNVGVAERILTTLVNHHRFLSYALYMIGFMFFVITLREGFYGQQLSQYCISHFAVFLLVVQGHFVADNILHGIFWLLVPCGLVIINDISAYLCGITMGRHPLIKISPKKTWEGFLGAWVGTILGGLLLTHYLRRSYYLICPMERIGIDYWSNHVCVPNPVFVPHTYDIPQALQGVCGASFDLSPIYFHVIALATFASLIAPFGGFFASGFKRTFKVKDFGDTIPGHGGITDRFDCQFIMGYFTWIYYVTFVAPAQGPSIDQVFSLASSLSASGQEELIELLTKSLRPQI